MRLMTALIRSSLLSLALALVACGDSGASGETATAGDGTTGGSAATGDVATTDMPPPELDPRIADCLRINACEADGGSPIGLHACLGHVLDAPWQWGTTGPARLEFAALECKLAATDCAGVRACTPATDAFASACAGLPGGDLCQGDTWVYCDDLGAPLAAIDCAAAGLACNKDIWAGCGAPADACTFGATPPSCDPDAPDVLVECDAAGFLRRVDCRTAYNAVIVSGKTGDDIYTIAGETCGFDAMRGDIACVGTGATCDWFSQRCDGDVLETCAGGQLARRDCTTVEPAGQGCGFVQAGQFTGAAACGLVGAACDLAADETCDAGAIGFCDVGHPATVDCTQHGYGGCATAQLGPRTIAYCTP